MKHRYVFALLGAALLGGGGIGFANFAPIQQVAASHPPTETRQRHTLRDFHGLQEGISYDNAARTLGHVGHEVLRGTPGYIQGLEMGVDVYEWPNPDGSRIVLVFRDDRMILKLQTELR